MDEYQALGAGEGEAIFLALTRGETEALGGNRYRITEHYPTGNSGVIDVTLIPDQARDPEAPSSTLISDEDTDEGWTFSLTYFVPYEGLPADVLDQIRAGSPAAIAPLLALAPGAGNATLVAAEREGVVVVLEALIKKTTIDGVRGFIAYLDAVLKTGVQVDEFYKRISAALSIKDSLAMHTEYDFFKKKLDALQRCVENPTNPITRRTYRDHPEQQQLVLNQIADAREEIKANVAVGFLNLLIKTGSSLIRGVPWLGWIIGPGTAWSKGALRGVSERLLADVEKNVVPCDSFQFEFEGEANVPVPGGQHPISWHYWGQLCSEAETWQVWEVFDGIQQNVNVPPEQSRQPPIDITFGDDGNIVLSNWPPLGPVPGTLQGTWLQLVPGDEPLEVVATINEGDGSPFTLRAPVVPRDGTFGRCPEDGTR